MYLDEFTGGNTYCQTSSFDNSLFSEMKKNKQASFTRDIWRVCPVLYFLEPAGGATATKTV